MSAERRVVFALGARLGMSAAAIEALSARELAGWLEFFNKQQRGAANDADAVPLEQLTRAQRRAMFHHGA